MDWIALLKILGEVFSVAALAVAYLLGRKQGRAADRKEVIGALNEYQKELNKVRIKYDGVDVDSDAERILSGSLSSHVSEAAIPGDEESNDRTL